MILGTQKAHKHRHFYRDIPNLLGFMMRVVYVGYPYPNFCLCAFGGHSNSPYNIGDLILNYTSVVVPFFS